MEMLQIIKVIGNEKRFQILKWLKNPELNFPPHQEVEDFSNGVCVGFIQKKSGLSQSTTSQYLAILEKAGLVISTRIGKWTYYRRNEMVISEFTESIKTKL